jgi:hypothetical protein
MKPKRHRWPRRPRRGACRHHDQCLDCGTWLNDAKRGGVPCVPPSAPRVTGETDPWTEAAER